VADFTIFLIWSGGMFVVGFIVGWLMRGRRRRRR
jgi:hypothetical protein